MNRIIILAVLLILLDWNGLVVESIWKCKSGEETDGAEKCIKSGRRERTGKDIFKCLWEPRDCKVGSDCCSNICHPTGKCGCKRNGETCEFDSDCCTHFCHADPNGRKICNCKCNGENCSTNQCCSGRCETVKNESGRFDLICIDCIGGGGDCVHGQFHCCSFFETCSDGKCKEREHGEACTQDSNCLDRGNNETMSCVLHRCQCDSSGIPCVSNQDCCSGLSGQICNTTARSCN